MYGFLHDWKSCIPHKGIKGSNPFFSATKKFSNAFFLPVFENFFCLYAKKRKKGNRVSRFLNRLLEIVCNCGKIN